MIKHVVFFKMKDEALGNSGTINARLLSVRFQDLCGKIESLKSLETGINLNEEKFDLCLSCEFDDLAGLEEYIRHPAHQDVRDYVFQVIDHREVMDYSV